MTTTELTIVGLLIAIAGQTTYTTYRTWKGTVQHKSDAVFVDTSVLMDGRIIAIAQSGFIPGKLVIPRSVVGELQFLADNADSDKRTRARKGLDVVQELQSMDNITVELLQDGSKASEGVDERLLMLAKKHGGKLCTIDFNLNKVAQVEGIAVLNVNELAKNLRMAYLPGDILSLELTTTGSDSHQAVGHLGDGTMVVVEQARQMIGRSVEVEIIRSLQTAAGRMMFAKLASTKKDSLPARTDTRKTKSAVRQGAGRKIGKTHKQSDERVSSAPKPQGSEGSRVSQARKKTLPRESSMRQKSSRPKARNNEDRLISLVNSQND